ncbi:hypothetical protein ABEB36_008137 [Hypothenemus hampei]|uniref:Peptidase S1 domain-containing protein n=1 Tax=Hypothenemus hampei TaxID=57062 RepID=A0ABD1EKV5_HYPHA
MMKSILVFSALLAVALALPEASIYEATNTPSDIRNISTNLQIVNGLNAARGQFPYQVSVQRQRVILGFSHICGGTIISQNWILSAAHCTPLGNTYRIVAGILLQLDQNVAGQQEIAVTQVINHPGYPGNNVVAPDDVSILRLARQLVYGVNVQPARIPAANYVASGTAVLSGWGITVPGGSVPNHLQFARLPVVSERECNTILTNFLGSRNPFDIDRNVCSGTVNGGESACSGDSGGPYFQNGRVVGIVNWVLTPCGARGAPSVYAKTAAYASWIVQNTNGEVQPL